MEPNVRARPRGLQQESMREVARRQKRAKDGVSGETMEARSGARLVEQMPAFDIKGTITPVTVLRLYTVDVARIERELHARIAPAPQMFAHAAIVIDVA